MTIPDQRGIHRSDDDVRSESRVWGIIGALLLLIAVVALIVMAVQTSNVVDETHQLNNQVKSCLDKSGDCYESNREQYQKDQAMANRVSVVTAWCLRNSAASASPADISNCVVRELEKFAAPPSPLP